MNEVKYPNKKITFVASDGILFSSRFALIDFYNQFKSRMNKTKREYIKNAILKIFNKNNNYMATFREDDNGMLKVYLDGSSTPISLKEIAPLLCLTTDNSEDVINLWNFIDNDPILSDLSKQIRLSIFNDKLVRDIYEGSAHRIILQNSRELTWLKTHSLYNDTKIINDVFSLRLLIKELSKDDTLNLEINLYVGENIERDISWLIFALSVIDDYRILDTTVLKSLVYLSTIHNDDKIMDYKNIIDSDETIGMEELKDKYNFGLFSIISASNLIMLDRI